MINLGWVLGEDFNQQNNADANDIPNTRTKWSEGQQTKWAPRLFLEESSQVPEGII